MAQRAAQTDAAVRDGWERVSAWASLLGVEEVEGRIVLDAHRDEAQVRLDVQRSFGGAAPHVQAAQRAMLSALVVGTLRTYPHLHYYQGFHDLVALLVVAAGDPTQWTDEHRATMQACTDRFALFLVRDSMAPTMAPVVGHLKIVRNILRAVDLPYALALERTFAPGHMLVALPWVLTMLAHNVRNVAHACNIMDYILREGGPAGILYLSAALLHERKPALLGAAAAEHVAYIEDMDPALVHTTLATLELLDDAMLTRLCTSASELRARFPLDCPIVRADSIITESSVLATWGQRTRTDALARAYACASLAPIRDNGPWTPPAARQDNIRVRAQMLHSLRRTLIMPRTYTFLLLSSMSLVFGGSFLSVLLALHLAREWRP